MDSTPLPPFGIAAVERETGLSKDILRKWESRYGFPMPPRNDLGERLYPPDQVRRLALIKRLMNAGMRPSQLVRLDEDELSGLTRQRPADRPDARVGDTWLPARCLDQLRQGDLEGLRQNLRRELFGLGLELFVLDRIAPLTEAVGDAWDAGEIEIHGEHLYSELMQGLLREAIANINDAGGAPRILLTTLPGEQHGLGLLMAAAILSWRGGYSISLGTQTPPRSIAAAARAHAIDIVVLSFSRAYPWRQIAPALLKLREQLDQGIDLWAGGAGTRRLESSQPGLRYLPDLTDAIASLENWRSERTRPGAAATP